MRRIDVDKKRRIFTPFFCLALLTDDKIHIILVDHLSIRMGGMKAFPNP
jgi:hypothetical protein